ncbi:glutathione-dependent formaldehyde-activating, GFA [Aspergillus ellipticus CBS 707.79]|uniref:Glutathione-dependent formaldehyde-activating, GFA n=1 Tax=Aspergillus ellipticus CBS 707.79 TaxID=1448320 RepID=A0A319CWH5_9EURO|nr:glutathione-dependent formaldehyde-activating, GFA [Aspergillus ellipticus CBS 707.79]
MEDPKMETYTATCHCAHTRLTFTHAPLPTTRINRCNCSICTKNGYLLAYPRVSDVTFLSGEDDLVAYTFGNRVKPHKFCGRCGTSMLIDFSGAEREVERGVVAINIRTVVGVEEILGQLEYRDVDGKNKLGPPYSVD